MYFFVICTIISMFVYMYFYFKAPKVIVFALKSLTSLFFVGIGLFCFLKWYSDDVFALYLLLGLAFGFLGDISLGLRYLYPKLKKMSFLLGILMFFVGHVFYSISFFLIKGFNLYLYFVASLFLSFFLIFITYKTKVMFGKIRYFVYSYIYISSLVLTFAFLNLIDEYNNLKLSLLIGAFLFVLSDILLCYVYFGKINNLRYLKMVSISTYYCGQIVIASSIYLI